MATQQVHQLRGGGWPEDFVVGKEIDQVRFVPQPRYTIKYKKIPPTFAPVTGKPNLFDYSGPGGKKFSIVFHNTGSNTGSNTGEETTTLTIRGEGN